MLNKQCLACLHDGPADADRCAACGTALPTVLTQPQQLHGVDKRVSSGAIWLDDLTPCQAQAEASSAADTVPGALAELAITLVEVEAGVPVSARGSAASAPAREEPPLLSDPEPRPWPACSAAMAEVTARSAAPSTVRAKAERRAAVRKSRLRGKSAASGASTASEVLVFDAHEGEREHLCKLLRDFGFRVSAAGRADEAAALAESHIFTAAFVDIALDAADGGAGLDLCQRVLAAGRRRGRDHTLLVLTAARLRPMDRVRAELAGCEETLLKPVTRGSVAGVLDSRGIALPTDRRQS